MWRLGSSGLLGLVPEATTLGLAGAGPAGTGVPPGVECRPGEVPILGVDGGEVAGGPRDAISPNPRW